MVDRVRIDIAADLARDVALARRDKGQRDKSGLQRRVFKDGGERHHQPLIAARQFAGAQSRDIVDQQPHRNGLQRLPAVERIAVVRREEGKIVAVEIGDELDRRREAAIDRRHRTLGDAGECKFLLGLV